jgi:5'-deoxynucleotidase YfbR-like HD superfamily hydrolase
MINDNDPKVVLDKVIFLYKAYSEEHRASTQPYHLQKVQKLVKDYEYKYDDLLVREPLIEHSGSLPIVATTIFPYVNNPNVNLGEALIMLAIHDIGELVVHDEITFTKKTESAPNEKDEALKMLHKSLHPYYLEMENRTSVTGRFAKAIDKITPDIVDLMTPPEITIERYRRYVKKEPNEIVATIKEFKHPYMTWNGFMTELHLEILDRIENKIKIYY